MPSTRRWSVPPKRIAATAVLGVIGIFLVCGSVGMGAWLVAALGIAVIAIGTAIFVLSALNSRATSQVEGTAHVVSASAPPSGVTHGRCRLNLVVYGKGINGVGVKIRDAAVPVAKWPDAGSELPVMISIEKPQRTRVLWGDVATHRESAEERARAREAEERAAARAAEDDEYAGLNAAFDNLDNLDNLDVDDAEDASSGGTPLAESSAAGPPPTTSTVGDSLDRESDAGESSIAEYQSAGGGEPAMAASGTRTIEMDVMDPSLMRWTDPRPSRPHGSRPSPFRRRRSVRATPTDIASDETEARHDAVDAPPSQDWDAAADERPAPVDNDAASPAPVDNDAAGPAPVDNDAAGPAPVETAASGAALAPATPLAPAPIESGLMVDNGQIVGFDLFEPASEIGHTRRTSRSAPPEWPPRSAAAAAAAAALPHQWDDGDFDDHTIADDAAEAVSEVHPTESTDTDGGFGRRVPRNRPAPEDELFDQDAPDDGPGYSPDAGYNADAGYDPDAGYNSDAGYAEPGQSNPFP